MPRNGSGVYSADWVNASPSTTIESSKQNAMVADLVTDANAARPITAGGTGETTARLKDGTWRFQNTADTTKLLALDLSGLTTATTRTVTVPDASGTMILDQGTFRLKQSAAPTPTAEGDIQWGSTNDEIVVGNGSTQKVFRPLTLGTAVASTSGTQIQFFIPAGARRITINFSSISTNGTNALIVTIGDAGGAEATGYSGGGVDILGAAAVGYTTAFGFGTQLTAAAFYSGTLVLTLENASTNTWCASGMISRPNDGNFYFCSGTKSLSQSLDRLIVQTVGATDTFDSGEINVLYE